MKKFIVLLSIFALVGAVYFFNLQGPTIIENEEKTPLLPNKKIDTPIEKEISKNKIENLKDLKAYIGPDFQPIEPPSEGLPMENEINPNFEKIVSKQFFNPDTSGGMVEIQRDGSFILVKNGFGRYVEKIGVTVTYPQSSPHSFNAFADSNTGEILQTFNDSESHEQESDSIDSLWEEERGPESSPNPEDVSQ